MAMTLVERLNFDLEFAQKNLLLAEKHVNEGKYLLAHSTNLRCGFDAYLTAGLMQWRHDLECPIASFQCALVAARRSSELIAGIAEETEHKRQESLDQQRKWDKSWGAKLFGKKRQFIPPIPEHPVERKSWWGFPYGAAIVLSMLVDGEADEKLVEVNCQPSDWDASEENEWDQFLDGCVIHAMLTKEVPNEWDDILNFGRKPKRLTLVTTTYETYMTLITTAQQGDWDAANSDVSRLTELFEERENDEYFSGGIDYEGGGPYNQDAVDFRLATIVKRCYADRPDQLESLLRLHLWRL